MPRRSCCSTMRANSIGSWWPTTWAARSTRASAPSRWRAASTWAWATRCPRTSASTGGIPDSLGLREVGLVSARNADVDVILIEVPNEVGGYGAKALARSGASPRPAQWPARCTRPMARRVSLPMDDAPAAAAVACRRRAGSVVHSSPEPTPLSESPSVPHLGRCGRSRAETRKASHATWRSRNFNLDPERKFTNRSLISPAASRRRSSMGNGIRIPCRRRRRIDPETARRI